MFSTGGALAAGGAGVAGGAANGGVSSSGGNANGNGSSGGSTASGGAIATGGSIANGGTSATGGAGGSNAGGVSNGNDASTGTGGSGGSSTTDGGSGGSNGGSPSTGPGDWVAGDYPPDINAQTYLDITGVAGQNGYTRQYKVHVPPGYDPKKPTPLVFCIHGLAQNAVMFCVTGAAINQLSDQKGFILVMPNGYQSSWNAGTCCGAASNERLNDVALFRAIFAEVGKHVNVDLGRVYATGLSNGGYMSYRLACEAADIFAAVAPGAGAVGKNDIGGGTNPTSDFTACDPSRPVSILDIHGTADGLIPYALQAPSLSIFAKEGGCSTTTSPAAAPPSSGDTTCVSYAGCTSGVEVTGCSIQGGGHCWFGSPDCGTGGGAIGAAFVGANSTVMKNNEAIWDFFVRAHR